MPPVAADELVRDRTGEDEHLDAVHTRIQESFGGDLAGLSADREAVSSAITTTPMIGEYGNSEARRVLGQPRGRGAEGPDPTGRFALPEEIAAVAVFLASDAGKMINGADLLVDCGYTIH